MNMIRSTFFALLLGTSGTMANAADFPYPETPTYGGGEETLVEFGSGWYLRGDVGLSKNSVDGVKYRQSSSAFTGDFEQYDLQEGFTLGAGIGYQLTNNIRIDATYKHHSSMDFTGSSAQGVVCASTVGTCDYSDDASLSIDTYMVNGYLDLGNYGGFTPYVGAGAGIAAVNWADMTNAEECATGPCTLAPSSNHGGREEKSFAYSLHTGFAFDIAKQTKMDIGYSFTHIDGGSMFDFESTNAMSGEQGVHGDLKIHNISAGIRYSVW
ncbi:MAG: outer membrane protein [Nitratireductor sp.]